MVEWIVQCATVAGKGLKIERFATKREALAFIRATPISAISKVAPQTYTIYVKPKGK